jgi:hypothetical protein
LILPFANARASPLDKEAHLLSFVDAGEKEIIGKKIQNTAEPGSEKH